MPVVKKSSVNSEEDLALLGIEYLKLKSSIKELESKCSDARKPLESYVKEFGCTVKGGSLLKVLPYADKEVHLKETLRTSKVLLPEAIDVLNEEGLEECIENVPVIREDVLERLYADGKVSDEVMQKLFALKKTFAFSVELKDKMPYAPEEG